MSARGESPGDHDLRLFVAAMQSGLMPDESVLFRLADAFWRILEQGVEPSRALRLQPGRGRKKPAPEIVYERARIAILVQMARSEKGRDEAIEEVAAAEGLPDGTVREYYLTYRRFAIASLAAHRDGSNIWLNFHRHDLQPRARVSEREVSALRKSLALQQKLKSGRRWRPPKK